MTTGSALPDHKLTLKIKFPVMHFCAFDPYKGHINRARYIVKLFTLIFSYWRH